MAQCWKYFIAYALLVPSSQGASAETAMAEPAQGGETASNTVASPLSTEAALQPLPDQPQAEPAGEVSKAVDAASSENKSEANDASGGTSQPTLSETPSAPENTKSELPSFEDKQKQLQFLQQIEQNLQQWEHQVQQWKLQLQDKAQQLIQSGSLQQTITTPKVQPDQSSPPQDSQDQSEPANSGSRSSVTVSGAQTSEIQPTDSSSMNPELAKILERKERKRLKKKLANQAAQERFQHEKMGLQTPTENSSPQLYQTPGLDDSRRQHDHDRKVRALSSELGRLVEIDEHGNQPAKATSSARKAMAKGGEHMGIAQSTSPAPSFTAPVPSAQH